MIRIGAVILAAGLSRRMGKPKLLLPYREKPLFLHSVETAIFCKLNPIVLVVGSNEAQFRPYVSSEINIVKNMDYESGMGSSLKCGINFMKGRVDAAFVFLADQPFVPAKVPAELIKQYKNHRGLGFRIFKPKYMENDSHPILFDADLFDEFDYLTGDIGGREIIRRYQEQVKIVSFSEKNWGMDIDTPEDYAKAIEME